MRALKPEQRCGLSQLVHLHRLLTLAPSLTLALSLSLGFLSSCSLALCVRAPTQGAEGAFAWSVFTKQVITPTLGMDQIGSVFLVNGAVNGLASLLLSGRGVRSVCLILGAGAASHTAVFRWCADSAAQLAGYELSRPQQRDPWMCVVR